MQFNKLYNLILLSIITEDINSKIKKAIDTLIKSGLLKDLNDPRILQVKTIIKRNANIDINGKTKLNELLKQNEQYINRSLAKKSLYLDSIPQFSLKKEYDNGVVIYRVADTKEAQKAVRKIVDIQWGKDSNPWCIITRAEGKKSWSYWQGYTAYPKHIAFQNGKLLAFCANDVPGEILWWDKQDNHSEELKIKGGTIKTEKYDWSPEEKVKRLINREALWFKEETGRYDSTWGVRVGEEDLVDGHYPIKFGYIPGYFDSVAERLTSLLGAPEKVDGKAAFRFKTLPPKELLEAYKKKIGKEKMKVHKLQRVTGKIWVVVYE